MITLTETAKEYISSQLKKHDCTGVWVDVVKGGCSGMQYKFSYCNEPEEPALAEVIKCDSFNIYINKMALLFIFGTVLDHEKTPTGEKLVFKNPNEKHRCGCGKSFSV